MKQIDAKLEIFYNPDEDNYKYRFSLENSGDSADLKDMDYVKQIFDKPHSYRNFLPLLRAIKEDLRTFWRYGTPIHFTTWLDKDSRFKEDDEKYVVDSVLLSSHNIISYYRSIFRKDKLQLEEIVGQIDHILRHTC